jgi:hypothetical protein
VKVIRIIGLADGRPLPLDGHYLRSADVNAHGGRGSVDAVQDPAEARRFPDVVDAMEYWRRQSEVRPLRPDGLPNRPLTAYTVEVVDAPPAPRLH